MTTLIAGFFIAVAVVAFTVGFLVGVVFANRRFADSGERVRDGWSPVQGTVIGDP